MLRLRVLILIAPLVGLSSCGPEVTYVSQAQTTYRYEFQTPGCTTGIHEFRTLREYCEALINETLNQSCASEIRISEFQTQCENVV